MKKWESPTLIALQRATPGEQVLAGCKKAIGSGADGQNSGCNKGGTCASNCQSQNES